MAISIRLPADDEALLERAASLLHVSKSEFIRRSIAAYAAKVIPAEHAAADRHRSSQAGHSRASA